MKNIVIGINTSTGNEIMFHIALDGYEIKMWRKIRNKIQMLQNTKQMQLWCVEGILHDYIWTCAVKA